jgi:predicted dehydrogenase
MRRAFKSSPYFHSKYMNIAFISTAHIHTNNFIDVILKSTDGRKVAAVWDDVADRGQRYAEKAKAPFVADLGKLLADPKIDGFIICAENTRHLPLLKQVIPVGKPVFCEKPLTTTVADLEEVRALQAQYKTPLFCGYFQPFDGQMRAIAKLINDGALGKITRIRYRNAHQAAYGRWFDNPDLAWFYNPELAGGGAFMDLGTHALHLVRTLFGPVKEVWAEIRNESGIYSAVDDSGIAQLRFASGVLGTVEAAWTQTGGVGGLEVVGSEKTIWNTKDGYVIGTGQTNEPIKPLEAVPTRVDRLVAVIGGKIDAATLRADFEATCDAVAIMAAAYESAKKGSWVKVG